MQLLAVILYSANGEQRVVRFEPGALNVITGDPATGKSALLDIVEYCLGRSTITMPIGPITQTVSWYAVLVQLPGGGRAFIARPAAKAGAASTQRAMLELGAGLEPVAFESLEVNADADTVREDLGRAIGIEENSGKLDPSLTRDPLEAHLGHALLLCLQRQGEIGNRDIYFHRQADEGGALGRAIQDSLPYFLGAVPRDQALRQQRLANARRDLRRAEADLERAVAADEDVEVSLRSMVEEAEVTGLLDATSRESREAMLAALQTAVREVSPDTGDADVAGRRQRLERERSELRLKLRGAGEQMALLESMDTDEQEYQGVVAQQISRLRSLDLLGDGDNPGDHCPVCGRDALEKDPSTAELRTAADQLSTQLASVEAIRPKRRQATAELSQQIDALRQELRAADAALAGLDATDPSGIATGSRGEQQAFTKGRIQHFLGGAGAASTSEMQRLEQRVAMQRSAVEAMELGLDADDARDQLTSRLSVVGADMTRWANQLSLEHTGAVRLDLRRLTVVADTDQGPAPLFRIGSAANWIGYHLIGHLSLHRYFTRQDRPVPRFLMLDQPTQAYYPSELEQQRGLPEAEGDRAAVHRLFELMRDVAVELAPQFQIIVCDHANLSDDWFQDAVVHNWREGRKLIPESWIEESSSSPPEE